MPNLKLTRALRHVFSLNDFERLARKRLPKPIFSYIYNGADDEVSLAHNRTAFNDYLLLPRMLEGVSARSQQIELFGQAYSSPFGFSPVGLGAMYAYRGYIFLA